VQEAGLRLLQPGAEGWRADGEAHQVIIGTRTVEVRVRDGGNMLNPNTAPQAALQALLRSIGVAPGQSQQLAQAMVDWRGGEGAQPRAMAAAPYVERGLPYGPSQAPFSDLGEIALLAGMTPDIFAALAPRLSLVTAGPGTPRADPGVQQALGGLAPAVGMDVRGRVKGEPAGPGLYVIEVAILGTPALARRATVQLGCGAGALTCLRIVEWLRLP
jgi:general secretion pathway protein K